MTKPGGQPNRPSTLPGNRPGMPGDLARPGQRPGPGNIASGPPAGLRPGGGNLTRPSPLPGNLGGNRPTTLPGNVGGLNRPGQGGGNLGGLNRPTTLPGNIGGPNRPGPGGGGLGDLANRPTTLPGNIGNRPGIGGGGGNLGGLNRPTTLPGNIGNRPGIGGGGNNIGNRPGIGGGNNIGNRPGIGGGNNTGIIGGGNNIGNNWVGGGNNLGGNNWNGGDRFTNINTGGWGGGGWGGGGGGWGGGGNSFNANFTNVNNYFGGNRGWGGGGYGYGPGFGNFGNWYHGCWGRNNFGVGFGTGLALGVGAGFFANPFSYFGGYGFGYPGVSSFFPTWGATSLMDWGLNSMASDWLASSYSNPYVVEQPVVNNTTVVYDYSAPIDVAAALPEPTVTEQAQKIFSAARDSFKAGDSARALSLADQALTQLPNDPVLHEFRALTLFALKRYDEAAQVVYAVLTAGPGMDWSTLVGLYPDVDTYTNQLRALEASLKEQPDKAPAQFLLGYHYLMQGFGDAARARFEKVTSLVPDDQLSAQLVKALTKPEEAQPAPAQPAPAQPPTAPTPTQPTNVAGQPGAGPEAAQQPPAEAPPPPARLVGTWKTQPEEGSTITLTLAADGAYTWSVSTRGRTQSITGQAGFQDGVLALLQEGGPPLAGKVEPQGDGQFVFQLGNAENAPKLTFTKG